MYLKHKNYFHSAKVANSLSIFSILLSIRSLVFLISSFKRFLNKKLICKKRVLDWSKNEETLVQWSGTYGSRARCGSFSSLHLAL